MSSRKCRIVQENQHIDVGEILLGFYLKQCRDDFALWFQYKFRVIEVNNWKPSWNRPERVYYEGKIAKMA